jgi:hypothetical protein
MYNIKLAAIIFWRLRNVDNQTKLLKRLMQEV